MILVPGILGFVSHERGSSRVWRRFADDQLEHLILSTIDSCRQDRIETPQIGNHIAKQGSRYGSGGGYR